MTNARGFSLFEAVIVIAITVLMLLALVGLYIRFGISFARQSASINVNESASVTLNELYRIVLQSDAIVASHVISGTTYTTGTTTLVLEMPSINASGDAISNTYDYAVFYATSTKVYRYFDINASSVRTGGSKTLTDALSALSFTYSSANVTLATTTSVDITTRTVVRNQAVQSHLTQKLYLQNN